MKKTKTKKNVGRFAGIPLRVLTTKAYTELSSLSRALLLELAAQYDGKNNGYLSLTRNDLKQRGFNSPSSNQKAIDALINAGFITKTIQGGISSGRTHCNLYGVSWQPSDERMDRPFQYSLEKGMRKFQECVLDGGKVAVLTPRKQNQRTDLRLVSAN
ncbi:hypothetical protein AB4351_08300 [Vibrio sp. 10N.261.51.F11]|uniref:hypothetical protein n=1 Tax=Vibrio sp. 10N.261.51.F11 TaxID=3229678 RepID=UPI003553DD54